VGGRDIVSGNLSLGSAAAAGGQEEILLRGVGEEGERGLGPPLKDKPAGKGGVKGNEMVEEGEGEEGGAGEESSKSEKQPPKDDDAYANLPTCSAEENWDYYQKDNHEVKATTEEECCAACAAIPGCNAWTLRARTSSCE